MENTQVWELPPTVFLFFFFPPFFLLVFLKKFAQGRSWPKKTLVYGNLHVPKNLFFFFPPFFPFFNFFFSHLSAFPTYGEHTSMENSMYLKISSFSFLHSFLLLFFLNFPNLSLSSLCFWIFLIGPIKKYFHLNMGT